MPSVNKDKKALPPMSGFVVVALHLKGLVVLPSSQPALDVASWCIAAKTVSELTGRPATSSTASPKRTDRYSSRIN